tara:strand:- start:6 stop:731 length:726 start_codon:yes stop_codon:yes gene_type:complete
MQNIDMKKIIGSILSLTLVLSSYAQVTINEVQADNDTTYTDLRGNYEDWVEFYNAGTSAVDMSGWMCIDDNAKDSADWFIVPAGTSIGAGEYLVLFCNSDTGFTTDFGLSKKGDGFFLMNDEGIVDSTTFGAIDADMSWARETDGDGAWAIEETPTPGATNSEVNSIRNATLARLNVYPNPSASGIFNFGQVVSSVSVYTISGAQVLEATDVEQVAIEAKGIYMIYSTSNGVSSIARVIVQ